MIKPFIAADLREVSPLVLAYIGDSIYELYARCKSATKGAGSNNKMHNNTVHYVSAEAQANSARILQDELTEKEADYFRRGKNSNPHAVSKNANHRASSRGKFFLHILEKSYQITFRIEWRNQSIYLD